MIHAIKNSSTARSLYKTHEDLFTSSIFERLMYLPSDLLQDILKTAVFDEIRGFDLQEIESIDYWPAWSSKGTSNKHKVIPDVFIRTASSDIIIEAKRYDTKQQDKSQWEKEIQAYYNEYADENKKLIFIALGGLHSIETEVIHVNNQENSIYKCSWKAILNTVQEIVHTMELSSNHTNNTRAIANILNDIILCFELFGFSTALWLERFIPPQNIKQSSIHYFTKPWTN